MASFSPVVQGLGGRPGQISGAPPPQICVLLGSVAGEVTLAEEERATF